MLLFKWTTRLSRFCCWLLLASGILLLFNSISFFIGAREQAPDMLQVAAIPLYISAALLLYYRLRPALFMFLVFVITSLSYEFSLISFAGCAIIGIVMFAYVPLIPIDQSDKPPGIESV